MSQFMTYKLAAAARTQSADLKAVVAAQIYCVWPRQTWFVDNTVPGCASYCNGNVHTKEAQLMLIRLFDRINFMRTA